MDNVLVQIVIALIIVILMGYISYNIYSIEYDKLFKYNTTKKDIPIFSGVIDYYNTTDFKINTNNTENDNYMELSPSINQKGGIEYSYNFWLYVDKKKILNNITSDNNNLLDHILVLKGRKDIIINDNSKSLNCSSNKTIMIKNPLIRLSPQGDGIVVEYNNIMSIDSYQDVNIYNDCDLVDKSSWKKRNANLLGVYDIEYDRRWFMVTIVMKEVASSEQILFNNKASTKIYINSMLISDKTVETMYDDKVYSATIKNNNSPLYVNPSFEKSEKTYAPKPKEEGTIKMADLKYFNYAVTDDDVAKLYNDGFNKRPYIPEINKNVLLESSRNPEDSLVKDL